MDKDHRRRKAEHAFIAAALPGVICQLCGATLSTFADACSVQLDVACPGFLALDRAKTAFRLSQR
jgi:hypothetical protein